MALAPADPIQSVHQFFALAEMPEVDDYERNLIAWHRERLIALRQNPTPAAWLAWYRDVMGAIQQLSARWVQPKHEVSPPTRHEHPHAAALARLKEASAPFMQRWNIRIQDQATALKDQLLHQLHKVPIHESASATHITFQVSVEERAKLSQYVAHALGQWSQDVEAKLTPSWLEHMHKAIPAERLPWPPSKPPAWPPVSLAPSSIPSPHFPQQSTRRPTLFQSILRMFQSTRSLLTLAATTLGGLIVGGGGSSDMKWLTAFVVLIAAPIGIFFGHKKLQDELEHTRDEQRQRSLQVLQSWVSTMVDGHKNRLQSLLSSTGADARSRLGEWVDASWPPPAQAQSPAVVRRDVSALAFSLNSVRSAVAARISQIELEPPTPPGQRS